MLKILDLDACPAMPMENGRGEKIKLVDTGLGTEKIDLHLNRLVPGGPRGRLHRHSQADNVYIVRRGDALWTVTQRFGQLPIWLLQQYNPDVDLADLHPGTQIVMPRVENVVGGPG